MEDNKNCYFNHYKKETPLLVSNPHFETFASLLSHMLPIKFMILHSKQSYHNYVFFENETIKSSLSSFLKGSFNHPSTPSIQLFQKNVGSLCDCYIYVTKAYTFLFGLEKEYLLSDDQNRDLKNLFDCYLKYKDHHFCSNLFMDLLDHLADYVYITDIETDEILYMNQTMREFHQLENPIGKKCWQAIPNRENNHCSFCPIEILKKDQRLSYVWEDPFPINNHIFRHTDTFIPWLDERIVHLQQSIDITDFKNLSKVANIDELTKLYNRRAGKEKFHQLLKHAKDHQKNLVITLLDINGLKDTNDVYSHREGDNKISFICNVVKEHTHPNDLFFRLSGDEFIVVFWDATIDRAQSLMDEALNDLQVVKQSLQIPYDLSFCYGVIDIPYTNELDIETLITAADEKMYENKRDFHIQQQSIFNDISLDSIIDLKNFTYHSEYLYDALVQSTEDSIFICNMKTRMFRYPKNLVEEFDLPSEVTKNAIQIWAQKVHPLDRKMFLESYQEIIDGRSIHQHVEYRAMNHKQEWVWLRTRGTVMFDEEGQPDLFAGIISNIDQKDKFDPLTGLYNKYELEAMVKTHIEQSQESLALMILNLDNFKHINQLRDRVFGDEVLRYFAQKICTLLPKDVLVYKLDSDEFAVVFKNYSREQIVKCYNTLNKFFAKQQFIEDMHFYCSISAGCAFYPKDASLYINLYKYAEYALERSKNSGKNQLSFYFKNIVMDHLRRLNMLDALRSSIENNFHGFSLKFQPIVDASTLKIIGAEALVRWHCEEFGHVLPTEFIPLLEHSRMIIEVGKWIFKEAVKQAESFILYKSDFILSVNLSYVQTSPTPMTPFIREVIENSTLDPKNISVEFTESYIASDDIQEIFKSIRDLNINIAMDDFGTGYSSLSVLKECPANTVKIDKAFVQDITFSRFDKTLIRLIIELCHEANMKVCLEGVETKEEYAIIRDMKPDYIQGYLFSKPCDAGKLIELLKKMD